MYRVTRAYKEGRAVLYYDIVDVMENTTREKVHKDDIVKLTEDGQIKDCKIQWWEGKPIVRLADKNIPIVKIEGGQAIEVERRVKGIVNSKSQGIKNTEHTNNISTKKEKIVDISDKDVVVGRLATKRPKDTIAFGYDRNLVIEAQQLKSSVKLSSFNTLDDLFNTMAKDFNIKKVEEYRAAINKKIKLDRKISSLAQMEVQRLQDAMCTYLMNMANKETQEAFLKYRVTYI